MTVSMEMVHMAKPDRERTNQNARIDHKTGLPHKKRYYDEYLTCKMKL